MKKELKISTLSIVCALCAAVVVPAFGASSVRSLGGAGTYTSASGAAAAKSGGSASGDAIASVRAGSMRVNNVAGATSGTTRSGSTRAATTPRLSIGKYLAGSSVISGGSSVQGGANVGGSSGGSGNDLRDRVAALEDFVNFNANEDTLAERVVDVETGLGDVNARLLDLEKLSEDLSKIAGVHTTVDYKDGVLTVVQDGVSTEYVLTDLFATKSELEALELALNEIILDDYAKLIDFQVLEGEVDVLKQASDTLAQDVARLKSESASNDVIVQMQQDAAALKSQVEGLASRVDGVLTQEDIKDFVKSADVAAMIDGLVTQDQIDGMVTTDVLQQEIAKLATDDDIANFMTSEAVASAIDEATKGFVSAEQIADFVKSGDLTAAIDKATANLATDDELNNLKTELQAEIKKINDGQVELANYYTKAQADEKFLTKENVNEHISVTTDVLANGSVTADKINTGTGNSGQVMMLMSNGDGTSSWQPVTIVE